MSSKILTARFYSFVSIIGPFTLKFPWFSKLQNLSKPKDVFVLFDVKFNDEFFPPIKIQSDFKLTTPDRKHKCIYSSGKSVPIINETATGFNGGIFTPFKCLFENFEFSISKFW